jgi:hypothetical protein
VGQRKPIRQRTGGSFGGAGSRFSGHDATITFLERLHDVKGMRGRTGSRASQ